MPFQFWLVPTQVDGKGYIDQDRFVEACKQAGDIQGIALLH